jgi:hypothetical protein
MDQVPAWLEITGTVATTIGVLAALYVAIWREPRKAREERQLRDEEAREDRMRYADQMAALQRAEDDRIAAQARKVVPSVNKTEMFGENVWIARVNNSSTGAIIGLEVVVAENDGEGNRVTDSAVQANSQVDIAGGMERIVSDAMSGALAGVFNSNPMAQMMQLAGTNQVGAGRPDIARAMNRQIGPEVMQRLQEAMTGQLMAEWPTTLGPNETAIMAFQTTTPNGQLRIAIHYEDEAGYRWDRADNGQPQLVSDAEGQGTAQ